MNDEGRQWYVVCTYNGHENKVKENLEKRIESMGLQDCLYNIIIPEHVETVIKDGKKINKVTNMFPGYVLVEMVMTDEAWYVVRNTSGVSGFIGSSGGGAKPFPLQKHELDPILKNMGISTSAIEIDYAVGDEVNVISGPFAGKSGTVESIDFEKETVRINKSYQRLHGEDVITTPKTKKSNRIIKMPKFLCEEMQEYLQMLYGLKKKERIFTVTKSYLHHEMDRGTKAAGVKRIRIHDLRHSHISLLIDMGFSAVAIADRVGHESIDITYQYAHLFPSKQTEMADRLDDLGKGEFENVS